MSEISTDHQLQQLTKHPMRSLISLCTAALLMGCASAPPPPKQAMSDNQYKELARDWVQVQKCGQSGMLSPAAASVAESYVRIEINSYLYDRPRFKEAVEAVQGVPAQEHCNAVAIFVAGKQRQAQEATAANAASNAAMQSLTNQLYNFGKSNTTYCNSIGTQTICSRY